MKNKILFSVLVCIVTYTSAWAQSIPNYSFETWASDTNYLNLSLTNPPLLDTAISYNPTSWTTSNEVTGGNVFNHVYLVTQSSDHYIGSSAISLRSDSLHATINNVTVGGVNIGTVHVNFVCPGFAVCGKFPINLSSFVNIGGTFNPALLGGAGIPVSGRKSSIGGYLKYTPLSGDTAFIIAILKHGSTVVAQAKYIRTSTDANYSRFEVPFVYLNCLVPDTMVYALSSGNPYSISNVALGAQSGLHMGSTLLADSIFVTDTLVSFAIPPFVANDVATTVKNTAVSIPVTVNDVSCSGGAVAVTVSTQGNHGTATVSYDSLVYTPAAGFVGVDTIYYTATVGASPASSPASVVVTVTPPTGVIEVAEGQTTIYPNPASSKLHISTNNAAITGMNIYDMLGKLVKAETVTTNTTVDLANFNEGIYLVRFTGSEGKVISSSRFSVVK